MSHPPCEHHHSTHPLTFLTQLPRIPVTSSSLTTQGSVHSSLRSLGTIKGTADSVKHSYLLHCRTLLALGLFPHVNRLLMAMRGLDIRSQPSRGTEAGKHDLMDGTVAL